MTIEKNDEEKKTASPRISYKRQLLIKNILLKLVHISVIALCIYWYNNREFTLGMKGGFYFCLLSYMLLYRWKTTD
ncbi:MAG: hypothetical protein HYV28_10835 [Ignavibacteriales bacterium]|nr:hypothetical protein [Ignavibacteriales bacterium]